MLIYRIINPESVSGDIPAAVRAKAVFKIPIDWQKT